MGHCVTGNFKRVVAGLRVSGNYNYTNPHPHDAQTNRDVAEPEPHGITEAYRFTFPEPFADGLT